MQKYHKWMNPETLPAPISRKTITFTLSLPPLYEYRKWTAQFHFGELDTNGKEIYLPIIDRTKQQRKTIVIDPTEFHSHKTRVSVHKGEEIKKPRRHAQPQILTSTKTMIKNNNINNHKEHKSCLSSEVPIIKKKEENKIIMTFRKIGSIVRSTKHGEYNNINYCNNKKEEKDLLTFPKTPVPIVGTKKEATNNNTNYYYNKENKYQPSGISIYALPLVRCALTSSSASTSSSYSRSFLSYSPLFTDSALMKVHTKITIMTRIREFLRQIGQQL